MTTGEKLQKLRKEHKYTQEDLADILQVSRQSISKWESDSAFPETEKLVVISKLYGCTVDYLLVSEEVESYTEQTNKKVNFKKNVISKLPYCVASLLLTISCLILFGTPAFTYTYTNNHIVVRFVFNMYHYAFNEVQFANSITNTWVLIVFILLILNFCFTCLYLLTNNLFKFLPAITNLLIPVFMVLIMNGSYNHNLESGWSYHMEIGCLCLHYYLLIWGAFALFQFFLSPYISTKLSEKLEIFLKRSDRFLFFYTIVLMFLLSIIVTITIAIQIAVVHDSIHNPYSHNSNPENTYMLVS